jgi:PAS domain S-box-containing protein
MSETSHARDPYDEIRTLRKRVAELERQLSRYRVEGVSSPISDAKETVAERAVAGFFEQPLVMIVIADLVEGRFLRVNQKMCDVLACTEEEILESSFLDRVHPDDHLRTMKEMERLIAGERTMNFRNRYRKADGEYVVFEWSAVVDPNRELCYAMAVEVT